MSMHWHLDASRNIVVVEIDEAFELQDIVTTIRAAVEAPELQSGFRILADHRRIRRHITPDQIRAMSSLLESVAPRMVGSRWAILIAENMLQYALMRMLGAYLGDLPFEVQTFTDLDAARQWLDEPAELRAQEVSRQQADHR